MRKLERTIKAIGFYIASTNSTIRDAAQKFGISKSTVHTYMKNKLLEIDYGLFLKVKRVLQQNKEDAPRRGGIALKGRPSNHKKVRNLVV